MSEPLTTSQVLTALIAHINASSKPIHIAWDEVAQWQDDALALLVGVELLSKSNNAQSLECNGCEHRCFMPVELTDDQQRAFIICDHIEMQSHIGRIDVPLQRLAQWKTSSKQVAVIITHLLGFEGVPQTTNDGTSYKLGMLKGKSGRRWVSLAINPLEIVINQHATPIGDLLYIENKTLMIDHVLIDESLNTPINNDKKYTPNIDIRESRRQATQALHQDWNDAYLLARKKHPTKSKGWHSDRIAKLPIAKGRKAGTIERNLK